MLKDLEKSISQHRKDAEMVKALNTEALERTTAIPIDSFPEGTLLRTVLGYDIHTSDVVYEVSEATTDARHKMEEVLNDMYGNDEVGKIGKAHASKVLGIFAFPWSKRDGKPFMNIYLSFEDVRSIVSNRPDLLEEITGFDDPVNIDMAQRLFSDVEPTV